ncbi:transporter substrate-binding domain-containing protein [Vibrio sp. JC009]|uniref:substrate-binding periplasmic protein n=1 Tax=Vibrio sp. JC009 TaxID=2912314 RepID=UPI0023B190F1|nr:transporter substrate-binding domain-containing protein [Vibrio sp. JC009]WED23788.1 transporter substrate-binding domain-containing protein [Vibrio sp. JC009]
MAFKRDIIITAMERTLGAYGPYQYTSIDFRVNASRALHELENGQLLNVFIALTNEEWESKTIPIRIPIRRGILNYRLLLVHKDDLPLYQDITSVEDLKALTVGLRRSWTTWKVLNHLGFNIISSSHYESLFMMLEHRRFHYIPRGINEIYDELEHRKDALPNVMVEPNLALYIPAPTYIFVSPKYPRLAKRLEDGLMLMVKDGTLEKMFNKHYGRYIQQTGMKNRRVIEVGNPLLPDTVPLSRSELWWSP